MKSDLERHNPKSQETILYKNADDIGPKIKPPMLKAIAAMLDEIKDISVALELETETECTSSSVSACMSEIWVLLEDLRASKLKAYGTVSEAEKALIEPHVLSLLGKLDEAETAFDEAIKRRNST